MLIKIPIGLDDSCVDGKGAELQMSGNHTSKLHEGETSDDILNDYQSCHNSTTLAKRAI